MKKFFWIIVLTLSLLLLIALLLAPLEIWMGWDMPLVDISKDPQNWNLFGHTVTGYEHQWKAIFMMAVLLTLPARLISVSIIKIKEG